MKRLNDAFMNTNKITQYDEQEDCAKFYYQNEDRGYDIICQDGLWSCNCQDFYHRNNYRNTHLCKHILASIMFYYWNNR